MPLNTPLKTATVQPHAPKLPGASLMTPKALISVLVLTISLSISQALARPNLTPEQLAKARETASQIKPPVDFDALLKEADRLGVKCEGDLTRRIVIKTCKGNVKIAQNKEEIKALDEENERLKADTRRKINALVEIADKKLNLNSSVDCAENSECTGKIISCRTSSFHPTVIA
jgi:hypothetical protein